MGIVSILVRLSVRTCRSTRRRSAGGVNDEKMRKYLSSIRQACATSVYGAVFLELEGRRGGGLYLEGASVAVHPCPLHGDAAEYGYGSWTLDKEKEERLWH
jgi:hypothetical protein